MAENPLAAFRTPTGRQSTPRPENPLAAFRTAVDAGQTADKVKIDVSGRKPEEGFLGRIEAGLGYTNEHPLPFTDYANQKVRALSQGGAFGFGDEIAAAGDATLGEVGSWFNPSDNKTWGARFDENMAKEKMLLEQFREESPVSAYGGEAVGALATALGTAPISIARAGVEGGRRLFGLLGPKSFAIPGAVKKVSTPMARPSMAMRMTKGAAGGGLSGGIYGVGAGKGPSQSAFQAPCSQQHLAPERAC